MRPLSKLCAAGVLLAMFSGCSLLPKRDDDKAGDAAAASPGAASAPAAPPLIALTIDAPSDLKALLGQYLDIARLSSLMPPGEQLEPGEQARLLAATPDEVRELLKTEGYFEPEVSITTQPGSPPRATVHVKPGPRVKVTSEQLLFAGDLSLALDAGDADATALKSQLEGAGPLKIGDPFRNDDWEGLKKRLLVRLRAAAYGASSITGSGADIDVPAQQASLTVVLDSGPLFRAGDLDITGLQRQDATTVHNLAGFDAGAPLTEERLQDFQQRLLKTGLYDSAAVTYVPDPTIADSAPVQVRIIEKSLQQATVGIGVSSVDGVRTTFGHVHRRPFDLRATVDNKFSLSKNNQSWTSEINAHPGRDFYRNLAGIAITRDVSDTDVVVSQSMRVGRAQDTARLDRMAYIELLRSRQSDSSGVNSASALSANYAVTWRGVDSVVFPTKGVALSVAGGLGQAEGGGTKGPFGRIYGKSMFYLPLGDTWLGQLRLEYGRLIRFRDPDLQIPDALGFRAGGDESVRGYGTRSLAPTDAAGNLQSGSQLVTASVEVARPIYPPMPELLGAVFFDIGGAYDHWDEFTPARGYGVGVRYRSPIGPLRIDLAYGQQVRKLRLHFSIGIAF